MLPMKFSREDRWYKAVLCGKPMMSPDVTTEELQIKLGPWAGVHRALGVKSSYTARIFTGGELRGAFGIYYENEPHELSSLETAFFDTGVALLNVMCEREFEQKRASQTLSSLRKTLSQMELGAHLTQSSFFYLNPETRQVTGTKDLENLYPHRNGHALLAREWVLPEDLPSVERALNSIYQEGAPEMTMAFRSNYFGSLRHFRVLLQRDTLSDCNMFFGAIQDVTKVTEKAIQLRETQKLCELSLSASKACFFVKDADDSFRYVMCNKAYAGSLGLQVEEMIGKTDTELFGDGEQARLYSAFGSSAMMSPAGQVVQGNFTDSTGAKRRIKTVLTPFVGATGRRMLVGSGVDITDLDDLTRNEKINGEILEEAVREPDFSVLIDRVFDKVMSLLQCDRVMLLTCSPEQKFQLYRERCSENCLPVGKNVLGEIFSGFSGPRFVNLKSGRAVFIDDLSTVPESKVYIQNHPDYQTRSCAVCPTVIDGTLSGVLLVLYNHRCQFREADRWLTRAMGHAIALLLFRERQQEAVKEAERAKSSFFALMSHEIRTPLNAIIGFSELLKAGGLSAAEQTDYLSGIASAGNALLALINDVLDLAKLESGHMIFQTTQSNFVQIAHEVMDIFRVKCAERQLELVCRIPDDFPMVWIDPLRVRQILLNLLGNAVKFTDTGEISVRATFTPQTKETGTFEFNVTDTGIGISEEDQKQLFQKFVQASGIRGTQTAQNGTGLGLALCRELAEGMNGTIGMRSELGKGSSFFVRMSDVRYCEDLTRGRFEARSNCERLPKAKPCSVLLVDDVPMNLKVMAKMLEKSAVAVETACNGLDALQKLSTRHFDCVMTDLWMPVMNGAEMAEKIRKDSRLRHVKIGLITADTESGNQFDISVFDEILTKPVTQRKMLDFLIRMQDAKGSRS
ncbi:MAG: ATP-binding protein [Victivallaceae bacterium]|nr:ATP-binding protein [Victivallaceae bacterium]